jgi:hypothetical protein
MSVYDLKYMGHLTKECKLRQVKYACALKSQKNLNFKLFLELFEVVCSLFYCHVLKVFLNIK